MKIPSALIITILYVVFALLWIRYSDQVVYRLSEGDAHWQYIAEQRKGYFFVITTAILLFILVRKHDAALEKQIKALTTSEQQYRSLFEASPMPIFIYDANTGRIITANYAVAELYGYGLNELRDMDIWEIVGPEGMASVDEKLNISPGKEQHTRGIRRHTHKDGRQLYAFTQDLPFDVEAKHTRLLIANDVTRQMQYIEAIEKQNTKLNQISYTQSHVVRAPLASLMGLINILKDTQYDAAEYKTILAQVLDASNKLDNVIRDIDSDARPEVV